MRGKSPPRSSPLARSFATPSPRGAAPKTLRSYVRFAKNSKKNAASSEISLSENAAFHLFSKSAKAYFAISIFKTL